MSVAGWTAGGFEGVREVMEEQFARGLEVGAAYSAFHKGRKVVDLWGGIADRKTERAWGEDTLVLVYSTTKGIVAMCANRLVEEGLLDPDAPVADYWPEFKAAGKEAITVAEVLSHRSALAWTEGTMTTEEAFAWDPVIASLAESPLVWEPGTDDGSHGYHATTYGYLAGEVIRRITGKSVGTYLADELGRPLGTEFHIGLPEAKEPRVARLVSFIDALAAGDTELAGGPTTPGAGTSLASYLAPDGPLTKALMAPGGAFANEHIWNSREMHAAEVPAANGITDARSLAKLYAGCVSDVEAIDGSPFRVLSDAQVARAVQPLTKGPDKVLMGMDIQWGLGFILNRGIVAKAEIGGPRAFGHFGMGGSAGWADPDLELGMGYVMNRMDIGMAGDTRSYRLMQATVEAASKA